MGVCHADRVKALVRVARAGGWCASLAQRLEVAEREGFCFALRQELREAEAECLAAARALCDLADCSS